MLTQSRGRLFQATCYQMSLPTLLTVGCTVGQLLVLVCSAVAEVTTNCLRSILSIAAFTMTAGGYIHVGIQLWTHTRHGD